MVLDGFDGGVVVAKCCGQNGGGVCTAGRVLRHGAPADVVFKIGSAVLNIAAELVSERFTVGQADDCGGGAGAIFQNFVALDVGDGACRWL